MSEARTGAERVRTARSLLLQAVESLDNCQAGNESRRLHESGRESGSARGPPPVQPPAQAAPEQGSSELLKERNRLFNFGFRRRNSSKAALNPPTKSKKKKLHSTWCHDFVCLSSTTATKPPSSLEIAALIRAGLGRKQLTLFEGDGSVEVHTEIMQSFPRLQEGGGYELMRVAESGQRLLQVIPSPSDGYSVMYLKEVLRQAKVYIRPVQQDLSLIPCAVPTNVQECPSVKCAECELEVPLPKLREHLQTCKKDDCPSDGNYADEDFLPNMPSVDDVDEPDLPIFGNTKVKAEESNSPVIDLTGVEQALVDRAVAESLEMSLTPTNTLPTSPKSLSEAIMMLEMALKKETFRYEIRREYVLCDLLRTVKNKSYDPLKKVNVWFVGEEGRDTGGLTREMWRLFSIEVQRICEGKKGCLLIKHDATKLQEGVFFKIGMLMGVLLAQGGSGFPFFAPSQYQYICSGDVRSVAAGRSEVPHQHIDDVIDKVTAAGDDDSLLQSTLMEVFDVIQLCGFTKPIFSFTHTDVPQLIECLVMHSCIYERKAELDQLILGLKEAGVLEMIRQHPTLFQPLFFKNSKKLCVDDIMGLFEKKVFSEAGTNDLQREQATYMMFKDLLEELEVGVLTETGSVDQDDVSLGLEDCLAFFSGANSIPAAGFDDICTLNFSPSNMYPTASTCALVLTLPTRHHGNYAMFREKMLYGFANHGGFGLC